MSEEQQNLLRVLRENAEQNARDVEEAFRAQKAFVPIEFSNVHAQMASHLIGQPVGGKTLTEKQDVEVIATLALAQEVANLRQVIERYTEALTHPRIEMKGPADV